MMIEMRAGTEADGVTVSDVTQVVAAQVDGASIVALLVEALRARLGAAVVDEELVMVGEEPKGGE